MLTFIVFILILGVLIFVHEAGHFFMARISGVKVEEFAFGFPPRLYAKKYKGTDYAINAIPIGGYVKMLGEDKSVDNPHAFSKQKNRTKLAIIVAGVIMNFLVAYILFVAGYMVGMAPVALNPDTLPGNKTTQVLIADVETNSPASRAGLQSGDLLDNFTSAQSFADFTNSHRGQEVAIDFTRGSKPMSVQVALRPDTNQTALGVALGGEGTSIKLNFGQALIAGAREVGAFTVLVFKFVGNFISTLFVHGHLSNDVAGPIGIYNITGQAIKLGFVYVIQFAAILSVNLALLNILPFPALDGGRAVFIILSGFKRGKIVKEEVENFLHIIGFGLLILLMLAVTYREVMQYIIK